MKIQNNEKWKRVSGIIPGLGICFSEMGFILDSGTIGGSFPLWVGGLVCEK
jgi:hypothetical protein